MNHNKVQYIEIEALGKKYNVYTRKIGDNSDVKLLLLHGGPGSSHTMFTCFDDYFKHTGYEYYYYDQLGSLNSSKPDIDELWDIDRFVDEVEQVRVALGLNKENFYLYGSSWGAILGIEYALKYQDNLKGLIFSSMQGSIKEYTKYTQQIIKSVLREDQIEEINLLNKKQDYNNPRIHELLVPYYEKYVFGFKMNNLPVKMKNAMGNINRKIYNKMNGPTEFGCVGSLKDWSINDRLSELHIPILFMGSEYNTFDPQATKRMSKEVKDGYYFHSEIGGHLTMWDDSENYFNAIEDFIKKVEMKLKQFN